MCGDGGNERLQQTITRYRRVGQPTTSANDGHDIDGPLSGHLCIRAQALGSSNHLFRYASVNARHPDPDVDDQCIASVHGITTKRNLHLHNSLVDLHGGAFPEQVQCAVKARGKARREQLLGIGPVTGSTELSGQPQFNNKISVI